MKLTRYFLFLIFSQIMISCSPSHEVIMPYKNWGYSGERLLPVKTNNSKFSLRIWINNSTSIDRVITISKGTIDNYNGYLVEYGYLYDQNVKKSFYKESSLTPKGGFSSLIQKVDSFQLLTLSNKPSIDVVGHQPISIYIVEIKKDSIYNIFRFETYYPNKTIEKDKYDDIEKFIFDEFDLFEKFRFKQNGS